MAFPQEHTNYAEVIIKALIDDIQTGVQDVNVENVIRFPDLGEDGDGTAFVQQYGRAILIRLLNDVEDRQASDTWESTYSFEARCYVINADTTIYKLSDLVEDLKHTLYVNQSSQTTDVWFNAKYSSIVYEEPEDESLIYTALVSFYASMRAS